MDWEEQQIKFNMRLINFISYRVSQSKNVISKIMIILYQFMIDIILRYIYIMNYMINYPVPN